MSVRKAVIPAAGLGTRFLPATLALPKELLPLDRKPAIHWVVEEAVAAGVETVVLVLARGKEPVAHYFLGNPALQGRKLDPRLAGWVDAVAELRSRVDLVTVYQDAALGLGHAVLQARSVVGDEPCAVLLPDDHFLPSPLPELVRANVDQGLGGVALRKVSAAEVPRYGIVGIREASAPHFVLDSAIEKPAIAEAPSDLAIMGRYVLPQGFMARLANGRPGALGEIQITDSLHAEAVEHGLYGFQFTGTFLDLGTWEGYLEANVRVAGTVPALATRLSNALANPPGHLPAA
jgi:UTP--glucose-1-phosphate uridylyltransferase